MTLEKLASLASTSVATVSKAFSGSSEISEETRERIFKIAREYGCFDKYNKNKFNKRVIAILCPEIVSEYYTSVVNYLSDEITRLGGISVIGATDFDNARAEEMYNYFSYYAKADGIILIGTTSILPQNYTSVPTVALGVSNDPTAFNTNLFDAMLEAVERLKSLGHTDIGFAGERLTAIKLKHFKSAMRRTGLAIDEELINISDKRFETAGEEIAATILAKEKKPTAIITAYDHIAIGIIKRLQKMGYKVPEDFSVVGMDDIPVAPYLETSLTTISTRKDEMLHLALQTLMDKIENKKTASHSEKSAAAIFVERESTAPPRKHNL